MFFSDGTNESGRRLVELLLERGVNPTLVDLVGKKAIDYLAPRSPISEMLLKPPGKQRHPHTDLPPCLTRQSHERFT
jgi:hypothetical protein